MYLVLLLLFVSLLLQNLHQCVKFRNHENDSLQITRYKSLIGVLILLYYSNIRIFSAANSDIGGGLGSNRREVCPGHCVSHFGGDRRSVPAGEPRMYHRYLALVTLTVCSCSKDVSSFQVLDARSNWP